MQDQFADARLKIKRADKHIGELKDLIGSLPDFYRSTIETDAESGGKTIKHEFLEAEECRRNIALITGDAIHNLKAALDYAWIGAVARVLPNGLSHAKFPIADTPQKLAAMLKGAEIEAASPSLFKLVRDVIKPYEAGNHPLWSVHKLNIIDKHRLVLPAVNYMGVSDMSVKNKLTGEVHTGDSWWHMQDGPLLFDFAPHLEVENKGELSVSVLFGEGVPPYCQDILDALLMFSKLATHIVNALQSVPVP